MLGIRGRLPVAENSVEDLLGGSQGDWSVLHQRAGHFFRAAVEVLFTGQLVQQPNRLHLLRIEKLCQQDQLLGSGDADQGREPGKVAGRESVSESSRDWKAESSRG